MGAAVSAMKTVIFWLAVVWTPGLAFMGYMLARRYPDVD